MKKDKSPTSSSQKTWSYDEITKTAEEYIQRLMQESRDSRDDFSERFHRDWAFGVFLGWQKLTMGWQDIGDSERLEALIDPSKQESN